MLGDMHMGKLSPFRPGAEPLLYIERHSLTVSYVAHTLADASRIGCISETPEDGQIAFRCFAK